MMPKNHKEKPPPQAKTVKSRRGEVPLLIAFSTRRRWRQRAIGGCRRLHMLVFLWWRELM
jgi:hypothetical protein